MWRVEAESKIETRWRVLLKVEVNIEDVMTRWRVEG